MGKDELRLDGQLHQFRPDAVLFGTKPGGKKDLGMRERMQNEWGKIATAAATPHDVPEDLYNNAYNKDPGVIAAAKVLQVSSRYPRILQGCFPEERGAFVSPFIVANDVVLELPHKNGNNSWEPVNKPKNEDGIEDIRRRLYTLLMPNACSHGYVEARFRCGGAAYEPVKQRGIFGTVEVPFWFTPFIKTEIDTYTQEFRDKLHSTNGSCRWDEPTIFDPHIVMINNVMKGDDTFGQAKEYFHMIISGALPGIGTLIKQTIEFISSGAQGSNTYIMTDINSKFLHYPTVGRWGVWRTYTISHEGS